MKQVILGIDPGVSGGYAYETTFGVEVHKWVGVKTSFAILESLKTACQLNRWQLTVYIEKVNASPIMSQSSAFKFGKNYGEWCAILDCLNMEWEAIPPQKWQMGLDKPKDLKGPPLKRWLKQKAIDLYPELGKKVTLTTCDGLLIHNYGKKKQ